LEEKQQELYKLLGKGKTGVIEKNIGGMKLGEKILYEEARRKRKICRGGNTAAATQ